MSSFGKWFVVLSAWVVLGAGPVSGAVAEEEESPADAVVWTCVAQSYASGLWYYWTSYNAYYSRNRALNACVSQNGYTCNVSCRWSY